MDHIKILVVNIPEFLLIQVSVNLLQYGVYIMLIDNSFMLLFRHDLFQAFNCFTLDYGIESQAG